MFVVEDEPPVDERGGGTPADGAVAFGGANGETSRVDIGVADCRSFGNAEKEDNGDEDDAVQWGKGMREVEILGKQRINGKPAATGSGARRVSAPTAIQCGREMTRAVGCERESLQNNTRGPWPRGVG